MTRLAAAPVAAIVFLGLLALLAATVEAGFVPDDSLRLWAGASRAGDGAVALGRIVAAYPTLPFLATALTTFVAPGGAPAPALVAATLAALLAGTWFLAFRAVGLPRLAAGLASLLLAFHPAMLRAAIGGPADMFFAVFLSLLAAALYDLRARSNTPEVMAVGLSLLALAFSHPIGAAVAMAAVPFLVFTVRPALVANSACNVVITLVFPTLFGTVAFFYLSWVFPGSGWSFFAAPAQSLAAWSAGLSRLIGGGFTGLPALDAGLIALLMLLGAAPIVPVVLARVRRRRPLVDPALVFAATLAAAAIIAVATGRFGDPTAVAVAAPVLGAVVVNRVPEAAHRPGLAVALLALGWLGGAAALALMDPLTAGYARAYVLAQGTDRITADTIALGGATVGRDGVLVDSEQAPAVVVGRGRARGLIDPWGETFALTLIFGRLEAPFVAVPDPHSPAGAQDRVNRVFPVLFRDGATGYRLVYQNTTWKLFERYGIDNVNHQYKSD